MTIPRLPPAVGLWIALLGACASSNTGAPAVPTGGASPVAASTASAAAPSAAEVTPRPSNADAEAAAKVPPRVKGQNPFSGVRLYVNEYSQAASAAQDLKSRRPDDAKLIEKIAVQPTGQWVGEWSGDVETTVHNLGKGTNAKGMVPVAVAYNIPNRDCGQYSKGGSASSEAYHAWIHAFAKAAGPFRMIVVLEPDALGHLTQCLSPSDQQARLAMLKDAVDTLEATPGVDV